LTAQVDPGPIHASDGEETRALERARGHEGVEMSAGQESTPPTTSAARPASVWTTLRTFGLAALWALFAALMINDALHDPYDPTLEATHRYGHNHDGALREGLMATVIELAVLYLVLRPWSTAGRPWLRVLVMLLPLIPWTLVSAVITMHAGGITMIHFVWLLAVVLVLVVSLFVSVAKAIGRSRRRPEP
jgi:hypothetical protein